MDSKQYAWGYLINQGKAGVEHSYYGGYDYVDNRAKLVGSDSWDNNAVRTDYLDRIKKIGVNWHQTDAPQSDSISIFNGTFCDSSTEEVLIGKLVLNNGEVQTWTAEALQITNVFEMMASIDTYKALFSQYFNEEPLDKS